MTDTAPIPVQHPTSQTVVQTYRHAICVFYGERIRQVREYLGWTQDDLCRELMVSQEFIAQIESGVAKAPADAVTTLAFKSGFPVSFFETPNEAADFPLGSLLFRAHADMKAKEQRLVHRHAQMAHELAHHLLCSKLVRPVPVRVPRMTERDPERAAIIARSELGLSPDSPVTHVMATMESAGVTMIALPREFTRGDAFSVWTNTGDGQRRPVVVMSARRPADRVRMTAAHELAHLVMHQQVATSAAALEEDARQFASAFLLPADAMQQIIVGPVTLDTFLNLKLKWGVAIQALIVRSHTLGLITQRKYKTLMQRLSIRGWRLHEPLSTEIPLERPRVLRQMAEAIYGKRIDYAKLAAETNYPETFVRDLLQAQAGKGTDQTPPPIPTQERAATSVLDFKRSRL